MNISSYRGATALAAVSAITVLSAAACGSSAAPSVSTSPSGSAASSASIAASVPPVAAPTASAVRATNSCNVITQAQAGAALGQSVKPGVIGHATVEGGLACVYYGPNAPAGVSADVPVFDSIRVVLVTGPNARKYFDDYRTKVQAKSIPGLGDQAYYDGFASLSVLKGSSYVRIAAGTANNLAPEKQLAQDALPNM